MQPKPNTAAPDITTYLKALPKAELHIHIEGSLEPELIFALAQRNGVALPYTGMEQLRAAYAFTNLQSFLDIYYAAASVLLREQDFYEMAMAYLARAHEDNVIHAEIFFDPQTHTARGVAMGDIIGGLQRACAQAKAQWGIHALLILCFLRHLSEEDAFATLEQALVYRDAFIGVGLDSSEVGHPPEKFARVFAQCRGAGLHVVAHAGEEGPPAYIWSALNTLQVQRIDHGVQSLQDETLMAHLARTRIPLTVCPLSNLRLCVVQTMRDHPLKRLLDAGLCVTINSDDPAYFGGYMHANWQACFEALELRAQDAIVLARNSFEAAFVDEPTRQSYFLQLEKASSVLQAL